MSKIARQPLYAVIRDALRSEIESGKLKEGALLPGEEALAKQFGCSRLTAHRAVRELAAEGLVDRRRKSGTRVLGRGNGGVLFDIPLVRVEIESTGAAYRYERLERKLVKAPVAITRALGLPDRAKMVKLVCRHLADEAVFQLERRWINPDAAEGIADQDFSQSGPNEWLLANVPYSRLAHEVAAEAAKDLDARLLRISPGDPVLRITRRTWFKETGVTAVTLLHPGAGYTLRSTPEAPR